MAKKKSGPPRIWQKHRVDTALARIVADVLLVLGLYEREHPLPPEGPESEDMTQQPKPQEDAPVHLTEKERRALEIIAAHEGIRATYFARKMWPNHHVHQGPQSSYHSRRGMWLCAGSFVAKLIHKGLADSLFRGGYKITKKGQEALAKESLCQKKST